MEETVENCDPDAESAPTLLSLVVQKNFPLPSMCRARLSVDKPKLVSKLIKQLNRHAQDFDLLNKSLSVETAILSKMGYKYSCKYRPFYFWSGVRRILQCCKRINILNVPNLFTKLKNCLESFEPAERFTYLPSIRLVEYFLIRFMSSVSLFGTTAYYCSKVFATSKRYLSTQAHNIPQHLLFISISSRLWTQCNSVAKVMIAVYTTVLKLRKCLLSSKGADKSSSYIPDNEKFPKDLYEWLKEHIGSCVNFNKPNISKEICLKEMLKKMDRTHKTNFFTVDEDIGELV